MAQQKAQAQPGNQSQGASATPSPWDGDFSQLDRVAASHNEATTSVTTRVQLPLYGDDGNKEEGQVCSIWHVTLRTGVTEAEIEDMINSMIFLQTMLAGYGGRMSDTAGGSVVVGAPAAPASQSAPASAAPTQANSTWQGPGTWEEGAEAPYMMASQVAVSYSTNGDPYLRVFDEGYFSKYGLPMYADSRKGPSPVAWYGLDGALSQGRPNQRMALDRTIKVYFYAPMGDDGKPKPVKAIVPFSMIEPDAQETQHGPAMPTFRVGA